MTTYRFEYRDENTDQNNQVWIIACDNDKEANNVAFELIAIHLEHKQAVDYKQAVDIELIGERKVRASQRTYMVGVITWKPYTMAPMPTATDVHQQWLQYFGN